MYDILKFIHDHIREPLSEGLRGIELLRYNTLAEGKYRQIGKDYTDFGEAQSDERMEACCRALEEVLEHGTTVFCVL